MDHRPRLRTIGLTLAAVALFTTAWAQSDEPPFPEEARKRLDYAIGKWRSETQYLDRDGNVRKVSTSTDERRFIVDDRVIQILGQTDTGGAICAWEFYDVHEKKYSLTSIDKNGQIWAFEGDLGETFVWTAHRTARDGGPIAMRFTHKDFEEDSFTAIGEISRDGGETWFTFSRQLLTRVGD